jgi:hypothetical protein
MVLATALRRLFLYTYSACIYILLYNTTTEEEEKRKKKRRRSRGGGEVRTIRGTHSLLF